MSGRAKSNHQILKVIEHAYEVEMTLATLTMAALNECSFRALSLVVLVAQTAFFPPPRPRTWCVTRRTPRATLRSRIPGEDAALSLERS
jgi:hypothetical protein